MVKIDASGVIQWQKTIGGSGWDELRSIQQTSDGGYVLGGTSESNIGGNKTQNSEGGWDYWVVKLSPPVSVPPGIKPKETLVIHPNPTTGKFEVCGLEFEVGEVQVFDLLGNLVLRTEEREVDLSSYPAGIYMVRVGEAVRKLVLN